jgi:hypothetical protein
LGNLEACALMPFRYSSGSAFEWVYDVDVGEILIIVWNDCAVIGSGNDLSSALRGCPLTVPLGIGQAQTRPAFSSNESVQNGAAPQIF